jgi:hypothetical protein
LTIDEADLDWQRLAFPALRVMLDAAQENQRGEALMIRVDRKLNSANLIGALSDLFILRGPPEYIRSDHVLYWEDLAA